MDAILPLIQRYGRVAWRQRWYAIAIAWAMCVVGWAAVMAIPNQYEASARLYVDADAVLTPLLKGLAVDNTENGQLDVLQRTLLSRPNLEKLISKTDLELTISGPADLQRQVEQLGRSIKVVPQTKNIFTISYRNSSPQLAFSVVQTVLDIFIESRVGNNRSDMQNALTFLQQQLGSYETQLQAAEKRRAEFRAKYVDLLPGADGGQSRLELARAAAQTMQGQLQDAMARHGMLQKELADTPLMLATETAGTSGGGGGGGSDSDLSAAERKLAELRLSLTDKHPDVIAARNLVEALRATPHAASTGGGARAPITGRAIPNPVHDQLKLSLVESEAQIASLQRQFADAVKDRGRLEEIARAAPGLQADYLNINRDYDVLRKNYEELLARREAMRISSAADTEASKVKVQVVDPPQLPRNPVGPKRFLMISGVLLAGLGCGGGLAFLIARLDQSFGTADDLGELGLPVIGTVSLLGAAPGPRRTVSAVLAGCAVLLLVVAYAGLALRILKSMQIA